MANQGIGGSGANMLLYGVMIRDKIKSADLATLHAYRVVAEDLLKSGDGDDGQLRNSLQDLQAAIKAKQ